MIDVNSPGSLSGGCPRSPERGQTSVVMALFMVALLGIVALAVDLGYAYLQQRHSQNYSDSAAAAGTAALTKVTTDALVKQAILNDLAANGLSTTSMTWDSAPVADAPSTGKWRMLAEYIYVPPGADTTVFTSTGQYVGNVAGGSIPTITVGGTPVPANAIHIDYMTTSAGSFFSRALGRQSYNVSTQGNDIPKVVPTIPLPTNTTGPTPTFTPSPTPTASPTASDTPAPPTATQTNTPSNTSTPIPPCGGVLGFPSPIGSGQSGYFEFTNNGTGDITAHIDYTSGSANHPVYLYLYSGWPTTPPSNPFAYDPTQSNPPPPAGLTALDSTLDSNKDDTSFTYDYTVHHGGTLPAGNYTFLFFVQRSSGVTINSATYTCAMAPTPTVTPVPTQTASATNTPPANTPTITPTPTTSPTITATSVTTYPNGGMTGFVLWGGNGPQADCPYSGLCAGQTLNFWGHSWAGQVQGGQYLDNPRFKGYSGSNGASGLTVTPGVGVTGTPTTCTPSDTSGCWTVKSGNSFPPSPLPCNYNDPPGCYLDMIVSTYIDQSGGQNLGNTQAIVKVYVSNPSAYASDPGHPGYATIVGDVWEADPAHPVVHCLTGPNALGGGRCQTMTP